MAAYRADGEVLWIWWAHPLGKGPPEAALIFSGRPRFGGRVVAGFCPALPLVFAIGSILGVSSALSCRFGLNSNFSETKVILFTIEIRRSVAHVM